MREPSVDGMSQEINARIAASAGAMTCKEDDDDERQDDGGGRAKQIEGKRQRQVIALAEAMRPGRGGKCASSGNSSTKRDDRPLRSIEAPHLATVDRPRWWPTACPHAYGRRDLPLACGRGWEIARSRKP